MKLRGQVGDRYGKVYTHVLGDRFWPDDFQWTEPDGTEVTGETVCDDSPSPGILRYPLLNQDLFDGRLHDLPRHH